MSRSQKISWKARARQLKKEISALLVVPSTALLMACTSSMCGDWLGNTAAKEALPHYGRNR